MGFEQRVAGLVVEVVNDLPYYPTTTRYPLPTTLLPTSYWLPLTTGLVVEVIDKALPLLAGNEAGCKWLLAATEPIVVP